MDACLVKFRFIFFDCLQFCLYVSSERTSSTACAFEMILCVTGAMENLICSDVLLLVFIPQPKQRSVCIPSGPFIIPIRRMLVEAAFVCGRTWSAFRFSDPNNIQIKASFFHQPVTNLFLCVDTAFTRKFHGRLAENQKFLQTFVMRNTELL